MKKFLVAVAFLAAAAGMQTQANAAFIVGSQAFSSTATTTTPAGGDVSSTNFTMAFVTNSGGSQQTGDFIGEVASFTNTLDTTTPLAFVFGNAAFGTFTPTSIVVNSQTTAVSRTYNATGFFTPGTDFPGGSVTNASLTITINQSSPTDNTLSASATLSTTAPGVPEPSTIVLLGTFCAPLAFGWMRRRRASK